VQPYELSLEAASGQIRSRQLSPVELTESVLDRLAATEPLVNAYACVTADVARQAAREATAEIAAGRYRGPLHGIPFGLKDIYSTKGILTSGHSRVCADNIPAEDATTTRKLQDAGPRRRGPGQQRRCR
jgi:aspartyl-tRNA(Asn)/glutamyl-tRNA(Gln) amidotransferase subunit A